MTKKERSKSHKITFSNKIIPQRLKVYLELSIVNQDETFLEAWYANLQLFALVLL